MLCSQFVVLSFSILLKSYIFHKINIVTGYTNWHGYICHIIFPIPWVIFLLWTLMWQKSGSRIYTLVCTITPELSFDMCLKNINSRPLWFMNFFCFLLSINFHEYYDNHFHSQRLLLMILTTLHWVFYQPHPKVFHARIWQTQKYKEYKNDLSQWGNKSLHSTFCQCRNPVCLLPP